MVSKITAARGQFFHSRISFFQKRGEGEKRGEAEAEKKEEKPLDAYNDQNLCVVCLDAKREMVYTPCGHLVTCQVCFVLFCFV